MKTTALLPFVVLVGVISLSSAQAPPQRPLSPPAETSATIGGKTVTVEYSAPSMRGRRIFGGLVPYGMSKSPTPI